jgi:hypothetical protein
VSRSPTKFWIVICMIVLRLALGDAAHAMLHADAQNTSALGADCTDHAQHADDREIASQDPLPELDCCEQSACECPCFHAPCVLDHVLKLSPPLERDVLARLSSPGVEHDRLTTLLRPPA